MHTMFDFSEGNQLQRLITKAGIELLKNDPNLSDATLTELLKTEDRKIKEKWKPLLEPDFNWTEYLKEQFEDNDTGAALLECCINDNPDQTMSELVCRYACIKNFPVIISALILKQQEKINGFRRSQNIQKNGSPPRYEEIKWIPRFEFIQSVAPPKKSKKHIPPIVLQEEYPLSQEGEIHEAHDEAPVANDTNDAEAIRTIPIEEIELFPNHPFSVLEDAALEELLWSIQNVGQLEPALVRALDNGKYQMLSGHRRKLALEKLGKQTMRALVYDHLSDIQAEAIMLETNKKRENLSPMEKATIYYREKVVREKMTKAEREWFLQNFDPSWAHGDSKYWGAAAYIAMGSEDSEGMIKRYLRLYEYASEAMQQKVDEGVLSLRLVDEIVTIPKPMQDIILKLIGNFPRTLTYEKAVKIKELGDMITEESIKNVLFPPEANSSLHKTKIHFTVKSLRQYFPEHYTPDEMHDIIIKLLEAWKNDNT